MKIIVNIIIAGMLFSFSFANLISGINGNMQNFLSMNTGSFIDQNYRQINYNTNNLYSMSFIQFPADIKFHEIFIQKPFDKYMISSSMGVLNYGTLEDISNNQFSAKEQIIKISIFNIESSSFTYGVSVAYQTSKISSYTSSLFAYSIGLKKSYFDDRFLIGLSLENYNDVIKYHSNVNDSLALIKKISTSYSPKFLPLDIIIDYLYQDTNNSELAIGIHGNIYKNFYLYSGKHIYLNNIDYYGFFNNLACGLGILINNRKKINNAFRIDLGVQHLTDGVLNIGTSLSIITLDNF